MITGKHLFEAYNDQGPNPWKTFDGRDVPSWEQVSDQVREKWEAAALLYVEMDAAREGSIENYRRELAEFGRLHVEALRTEREIWQKKVLALEQQLEMVNVESFIREAAHWKAEAQRWADRNRTLENRARHAIEVLRGELSPPEMEEIREVRRLEPLDPWTTQPTPYVPPIRDTGDLEVEP